MRLSVGGLAERVGKPPTAVPRHLAKLRWGRIVQARQEGTRVFYCLVDKHARSLVQQAVFQAQHVVGGAPQHHVDASGAITVEGAEPGTGS